MQRNDKKGQQSIAVLSAGMKAWFPEIEALTGRVPCFRPLPFPNDYDAVCGWGHKPTSLAARARARRMGLPYLAIEDGFFRSVEPGTRESASLICDDSGIYYDAASASKLERLIALRANNSAETNALGQRVLECVLDLRLSKYNSSRKFQGSFLPAINRPHVLVVDQTFGDQSVAGAGATNADFERMLAAAILENPGCNIILKTHPETITGKKRGHFNMASLPSGVLPLVENVAPAMLLPQVSRVYCVSSQLGFEALCHGVPVTCFGVPFYAGWGLTDDRMATPPRRKARPTLEGLVAAALHDYPTYFDVYERKPCDIWQALEQLAFLRDRFQDNRLIYCVGVASWKRNTLRSFLRGPDGDPRFVKTVGQASALATDNTADVGVWVSKPALRTITEKDVGGAPLVRIEDGFLRSVGLGAAFAQPLSLVFDRSGIYYDPQRPSDLETLCNEATFSTELLHRAARLRNTILEQRISKYNVAGTETVPSASKAAVLVVGQVEDDASVALASTQVQTNLALLAAARKKYPEGLLIYRPHPDVSSGLRRGHVAADDALQHANAIDTHSSITSLLDRCSRVVTLSSLTGFEALLRGIPVTTFGKPFYAGWGLTDDMEQFPRRGRKLSLDQLVAAALILYPRYVDPVSGLPCTVERAITRLIAAKKQPANWRQHLGVAAGRVLHQVRSRF